MKKYLSGKELKNDILKEIEACSQSYYIYIDHNGKEVIAQWDDIVFFEKRISPIIGNKELYYSIPFEYNDDIIMKSIEGYNVNINKNNKLIEQIDDLCFKNMHLWAFDFEKDLSNFLHYSLYNKIKNKINDKKLIVSKKENSIFTYKVGVKNKKEDEYTIYYLDERKLSKFERIYNITRESNKTLYIAIDNVLYEIHPLKKYNYTSITIDELPISGNYDFEIIDSIID